MTRDEVLAWAADGAQAAMRDGNGPDGLFYLGVRDAAVGEFGDVDCGAPGSIWESMYCEGGREGLLRLEQSEPSGRVQHGAIVEGQAA